MKIRGIEAVPVSFRMPQEARVTLGLGRTVKRDAVVVQVRTDDGLVGHSEARPVIDGPCCV